jgi:hypothetical protein
MREGSGSMALTNSSRSGSRGLKNKQIRIHSTADKAEINRAFSRTMIVTVTETPGKVTENQVL